MHSATDPARRNLIFVQRFTLVVSGVMFINKTVKHMLKSIPCYCFILNMLSYFPDFAASFLNLVIPSLLCQQCQGKDVLCTNGRCLSQTSPSHLKALSRSTTTQCMNTIPWLVVGPAKASPLLWWLNRNPEILHMIQVGPCFKLHLSGLSLWWVLASDWEAPDHFLWNLFHFIAALKFSLSVKGGTIKPFCHALMVDTVSS